MPEYGTHYATCKTVIVEYAKKLPANTRDKLLRKIAKKICTLKHSMMRSNRH